MTDIKCGWVAAYCRHIFYMKILKTNMHKPSNLEDRMMTNILIGIVRISKGEENIYQICQLSRCSKVVKHD